MAIYRFRYCQRCSTSQKLGDHEEPRPCHACGGTQFDARPAKHTRGFYELTPEDRIFLRVQGIHPEED